jgi:hypothetical protein
LYIQALKIFSEAVKTAAEAGIPKPQVFISVAAVTTHQNTTQEISIAHFLVKSSEEIFSKKVSL